MARAFKWRHLRGFRFQLWTCLCSPKLQRCSLRWNLTKVEHVGVFCSSEDTLCLWFSRVTKSAKQMQTISDVFNQKWHRRFHRCIFWNRFLLSMFFLPFWVVSAILSQINSFLGLHSILKFYFAILLMCRLWKANRSNFAKIVRLVYCNGKTWRVQ